jgi:hypothetical protein
MASLGDQHEKITVPSEGAAGATRGYWVDGFAMEEK